MPASPLSSPEMRRQRSRIAAIPESARSAEDWLTLAEVALSYDGQQAALAAAAHAREFRLAASQKARLDLIDALVAGAREPIRRGGPAFQKAAPRLDARRRAIALYGGLFRQLACRPGPGAAAAPRSPAEGPTQRSPKPGPPASSRTFRRRSTSSSGPRRGIPTIRPCRPSMRSLRFSSTTASRRRRRSSGRSPSIRTIPPRSKHGPTTRLAFESDLEGALADLDTRRGHRARLDHDLELAGPRAKRTRTPSARRKRRSNARSSSTRTTRSPTRTWRSSISIRTASRKRRS